ncbi:MAG: hypothetical protein WB297_18230 [Actinomycetota bacterium]
MRWVLALAARDRRRCRGARARARGERREHEDLIWSHFLATIAPGDGTPLEPVRTRYSEFEPPFTCLVPEGWSGGHEHEDYFDIWNGEDLMIGVA